MNSMYHIIRIKSPLLFLRGCILCGYAAAFAVLIITGSVYRYVHENHIFTLTISAVVFFIIGTVHLYKAASHYTKKLTYTSASIFMLPLISMLFLTGSSFDFFKLAYSNTASQRDSIMLPAEPKTAPLLKDGSIIMDDAHFASWLTELYTNAETWEGKRIVITAFIWKDEAVFAADECALARMMMVCCAADMQPVGIFAQWDKMNSLDAGLWVKVTGTIAKRPYKDTYEPIVLIETAQVIQPPLYGYIYP